MNPGVPNLESKKKKVKKVTKATNIEYDIEIWMKIHYLVNMIQQKEKYNI